MYGVHTVQLCLDAHDVYIAAAYYMDYIELYQIVCLISTLSLRIYFPPRCYIIRIIYSFIYGILISGKLVSLLSAIIGTECTWKFVHLQTEEWKKKIIRHYDSFIHLCSKMYIVYVNVDCLVQ